MINLEQIRAARAMLNWKQQELAEKAGISTGTLNNIERGIQTDPKISTMRAIQNTLEAAGIEFTESAADGFGIRLKAKRPGSDIITLLIVDDSNADRKLYKAWLDKQTTRKYKIIEAEDGKAGYEAFISHEPDCVILDFMMYGMNGFQLLLEMRKERTVLPPIIFLTGSQDPTLEKSVKATGVSSYLNKNRLSAEQLYAAVEQAIG